MDVTHTPAEQSLLDRPTRKQGRRRLVRPTLWLIAGLLLMLIALGVAHLVLQQPYSGLVTLEGYAWRFKFIGACLQVLVVAAIGWRWPGVVDWAVRRGVITERERAPALAARWKAVLITLALILAAAIGPGDVARLYHALLS